MRNGTRLLMYGDSTFISGPIVDTIGLDGKGTGVDEMLQCTFETDMEGLYGIAISSEIKSFIKALKNPLSANTGTHVPTVKRDTTVEDSSKIFGKSRELTTSSPSSIYHGHYIATCENETLASVNHIFMTTPFKVGKPLTRLANILHCMIQKLKVVYMRASNCSVYEADFNTML